MHGPTVILLMNCYIRNKLCLNQEDSDYVMEDEAAAGVFDEPISINEVTGSISKLKLGKSAGPDKIVSEMLKYVDQNVAFFFF